KSFAYLVPLILHSIKNGEKIVISTNTKSLQQQMTDKDLPFLKKMMNGQDQDFTFKVFYGSNNYICLKKTEEFLFGNHLGLYLKQKDRDRLVEYINHPASSGIRYDIKLDMDNQVWMNLNRDADLCLKKNCRFYNSCFYYKNVKEVFQTDIIVVNHHLFFANIRSGYSLLPRFNVFVWDEAHNVEDVASRFLADTVSETEVQFLLNQIMMLKESGGTGEGPGDNLTSQHQIRELQNSFKEFFDHVRRNFKNNTRVRDQVLPNDILLRMESSLPVIRNYLKLFENMSDETDQELDLIYRKLLQIRDNLGFFLAHDDEEYVYWIEKTGRREYVELKHTPINIAGYLNTKVFSIYPTGILTSATLSTNNDFQFIKSRLGLKECRERIFPSPFNFRKQVRLYFNKDLALPAEEKGYIHDISREITRLLKITQGKAFILFTSYETLKQVKKKIEGEVEYKLLVQNEKPFPRLLAEFKKDINSVLMATMSFWEGVDVPGEALSSVIITRLPFDMPDDPIVSARIEYMKKHDANPFMEYQLPNAIILLKQGFGRLIRNSTDRGIVAILDSRIARKSYGRIFLNSLPECGMLEEEYDWE
ncbi:MAG: helicase C-terminal domain-containing protein, partial [bacterium]|nr:helicase C-terminal domain-containing protein [bacterium]